MGLGGIGPASLLLILLIVILLFGTKRIRSIGSDLGAALKNFRKGINDAEKEDSTEVESQNAASNTQQQTSAEQNNDDSKSADKK